MTVRPYRIDVPDAVLADLRDRLARTRWPSPIPGQGWGYGVDISVVRDLCERWMEFDWRSQEAKLNEQPQFMAEIDGVELHFWHIRGRGPAPIPLLLLHGWPGSPVEFWQLLGPLSDPAGHGADSAPAFDVVVGTLPGFGFGGQPREPGWGLTRIAEAFHTLMTGVLGYRRYGVQGGDIGGLVAARLGSLHPEALIGIHANFLLAQPPGQPGPGDEETVARLAEFQRTEFAYAQVQGTKPDSLTLAQSDSPAGLAGWILEKFHAWSAGDDVLATFPADVLLTNLMFYWAPNSAPSAARVYLESWRDPAGLAPVVGVPTAVAVFPGEPWRVPRSWAEPRFNIQRWTELPRGGHFAALEEPQLLTDDIRAFFWDPRVDAEAASGDTHPALPRVLG